MPNYANGKIYKIECSETGEVYFGSTCLPLSTRFGEHRRDCKSKNLTSKSLISRGKATISLVEDFACENRKQLEEKERFYIENYECVNKKIPGGIIWGEEIKCECGSIVKRENLAKHKKTKKHARMMSHSEEYTPCGVCGDMVKNNPASLQAHKQTNRHVDAAINRYVGFAKYGE